MSLPPEYVAGLFDGEGTVSIIYSKIRPWKSNPTKIILGFRMVSGLSNTFTPVLHMLQDQFGGDINIAKPRNETLNHKPISAWKIVGHERQRVFLKTIQPFSIIKRQQIELGLLYLETSITPGQRLSPEAWEKRKTIFQQLRELNKRGIGRAPRNTIPDLPPEGQNPGKRGYSDAELAEMMLRTRSTQRYQP